MLVLRMASLQIHSIEAPLGDSPISDPDDQAHPVTPPRIDALETPAFDMLRDDQMFADESLFPLVFCRATALDPVSLQPVSASAIEVSVNPLSAQTLARYRALEHLCLRIATPLRLSFGQWYHDPRRVEPSVFHHQPITTWRANQLQHSAFHWWPAIEWQKQRPVALPAQTVSLSDAFANEFPIVDTRNRIGTVCTWRGEGDADRILSAGLLEWIASNSRRQAIAQPADWVRVVALPAPLRELTDKAEAADLQVNVFVSFACLGVPSALVLCRNQSDRRPDVSWAVVSQFDVDAAIERALLESLCHHIVQRERDSVPLDARHRALGETSFIDACSITWHEALAWLGQLDERPRVAFDALDPPTRSLPELLAEFALLGTPIYLAQLPCTLARELGLRVGRVIVPAPQAFASAGIASSQRCQTGNDEPWIRCFSVTE